MVRPDRASRQGRDAMQWVLQKFDDTEALDRLGVAYTWRKVIPFVGDLVPEPEIRDPDAVVMFGYYAL